MKRIWLALAGLSLLSVLIAPLVVSGQAIPPAAPNECAKLRRDAGEVNGACTANTIVGFDENHDTVTTCSISPTGAPDAIVADWGACVLISNIKFAVDFVFWGFLLIAIAFFVWGGFTMMSAQGDPEKFATGRRFVLYGAIGLLVAIASRLIPAIIRGFMGF